MLAAALLVAISPLHGQTAVIQRAPAPLSADSVSALRSSQATATVGGADARAHHIRAGALTGVVVGAALGVFAGAKVPVGCDVGNCHKPHARVTAIVGLGSMGAVAGALVGAVIGAIVPTGTSPRPSGSSGPAS